MTKRKTSQQQKQRQTNTTTENNGKEGRRIVIAKVKETEIRIAIANGKIAEKKLIEAKIESLMRNKTCAG